MTLARWLVSAQEAPSVALRDWDLGRHALLRTGTAFDAVRMPEGLVHAAVGGGQPREVADALTLALLGPVICDPGACYYALVPRATAQTWRSPLAVVRSTGCWLTVPRTDRNELSGIHWSVPPRTVGQLCAPADVDRLLRIGEAHRARAESTAALMNHGKNCAACSVGPPLCAEFMRLFQRVEQDARRHVAGLAKSADSNPTWS
ncbi:hypothetical protein [Streptomyces sp. NPDC051569]|uniref:hypothetical protein n=1 Tax=Streptomyces sp. NPDC051569 TaxID=3365661 RepID=UPI00379FE041